MQALCIEPVSSSSAFAPSFSWGISEYLGEILTFSEKCVKNNSTTAIHARSSSLEIYRQFPSTSEITESIRRNGDLLPGWNEWHFWKSGEKELTKLEREVVARMKRHGKQRAVYTRGVLWDWRPILIHAYKFEPDPRLKLELIIPTRPKKLQLPEELSLRVVSDILEVHDYLVPSIVKEPLPPYAGHETKFLTLSEFLDKTMPKDAIATQLCKKILSRVISDGASHSQSEWKAEAPSLGIPLNKA